MKRVLVTCGLDYANGPMHLGHLLEKIQADIFVRAQRMSARHVLFVCGADSHGTPIELAATAAGKQPQELAQQWQQAAAASFAKFHIAFDGEYGTTHTPQHQQQVYELFARLKKSGHVQMQTIQQLYDPQAQRFLPDRLVRGTCPRCNSPDQYGDSCEVCGGTYSPTDLTDARSALSGAKPIVKQSEHLFFCLQPYAQRLQQWLAQEGVACKQVQNSVQQWLQQGLRNWDISRDAPYFGIEIPQHPNLFFYVWLDAPIGYMSLCDTAAATTGQTAADYWENSQAEIIHFLGKDIVSFHALFWPAMLMASGYQLPSRLAVHGMLTVNGQKMSKSRGTFITADAFAQQLDPQLLRYYLASKLTNDMTDIDLAFADLLAKVNADLAGGVVNVLSRTFALLQRHFQGKLSNQDPSNPASMLRQQANTLLQTVQQSYAAADTARVVRDVMAFAHQANIYLQQAAPWNHAAQQSSQAHQQLSTGLWAGSVAVGLLAPVLPIMATKLCSMLRIQPYKLFSDCMHPLPAGHCIGPYERLCERVNNKQIDALLQQTNEPAAQPKESTKQISPKKPEKPKKPQKSTQAHAQNQEGLIDFKQFSQVQLHAAYVTHAQEVADSNKLIALTLDVGPLGQRHVLTGLRPHVSAQQLLHKTVVLVSNLKPRTMRFGTSEGMILACGNTTPQPIFVQGQPGDPIC
ncbi:MAG: methionine--tRNA ligase [Myxococcota bacterium]